MRKLCLECQSTIKGRSDKKFCSEDCRSTFHYKKNREFNHTFRVFNKILKRNRNVLKKLNPDNHAKLTKEKLLFEGFRFGYFTHLKMTEKGQILFGCYDFGYTENQEGVINILQEE